MSHSHIREHVELIAKHEEDFLARITDAAYRVALKHGFKGSFVDLQLELWSVLRDVVARHVSPRPLSTSARTLAWKPSVVPDV